MMILILFKRLLIMMMTVSTLFSVSDGRQYGDYCGDYDFPRISAERQSKDAVRIMSFNIRCGDVNGVPVSDRIGIAVRQIREVLPDSLGIQEATPEWMAALDRRLPLYGWVGVDRETGGSPKDHGESCPIFYLKLKYRLADSGSFWISDTPNVPSLGPGAGCIRVCTWAKLQDRLTGETFVHVNTHYDHVSEQARVQGALIVTRFIEEHFSDVPVVFTADMNTTEKGKAYETMTKSLRDARFIAADSVTYGTFHAGKDPSERADYYIDFVLCSSEFDVAAYRTLTRGVNNRFVSDHFPIYADLKTKK